MPELNERTLVMAIQGVDAEMRRIGEQIETTEGPEQADLEELLLAYSLAAGELKEAYLHALEPGSNLPAYSELVSTHGEKRR
jgi:hypothetical protein